MAPRDCISSFYEYNARKGRRHIFDFRLFDIYIYIFFSSLQIVQSKDIYRLAWRRAMYLSWRKRGLCYQRYRRRSKSRNLTGKLSDLSLQFSGRKNLYTDGNQCKYPSITRQRSGETACCRFEQSRRIKSRNMMLFDDAVFILPFVVR